MAVRVLWATKGLGPGGTERLLVELARTIDRSRVEVTAAYVVPWKDHLAGELEAAGVRTSCLSQRRRDPSWPWRLRALIGGIDVVHAQAPLVATAARLAVRTLPRRRRPAVVVTEHNTWDAYGRLTRWANRLTGGRDDATLTVTAEAKVSMRGQAARRAEVLVHGVDVTAIRAGLGRDRDRIRAELGLASDDVVIGTIANFRDQKDYPNLLSAAQLLVGRGVPFRLVAVGQGPLEQEIRDRCRDMALAEHVMLLGFRADAVTVLAACDVFVLASAWEGLPVALMEASALGLPIVATQVGGVAEQLDNGDGVLVPPRDPGALADALAAVVADRGRRSDLAAASSRVADRFDIRRTAAILADRYEQVCRRPVDPAKEGTPVAKSRSAHRAVPTIRAITADDRDAVIALLRVTLGWGDDPLHRSLYVWKHEDNRFGPSPGWVIEDGGEIVALRLMMRWAFRRGGRLVPAVRAVDTATRPDYQGAGLFSALTRHAIEWCQADGVAFVFNTPNEQSRPGYLKMGWRDVGRLPGAFRPQSLWRVPGFARNRLPAELRSLPLASGSDVRTWLDSGGLRWNPSDVPVSTSDRTLRTAVDEEFLRWRYGLPELHYRVIDDGDAAVVVRLRRRGGGRELVVAHRFGNPAHADRLAGRVLDEVQATHALRLGAIEPGHGFLPLPGRGPRLTWRGLADPGPPPLPNWDFQLGDIELF